MIYLRLIFLTLGTLLPFFWMVVILGHRRQRNFERVFFFLCLALVFYFGGSLLALNTQLHYAALPSALERFCWIVVCLGVWFLPALLVHLHAEYARIRELLRTSSEKALWRVGPYAVTAGLTRFLARALRANAAHDFILPSTKMGWAYVCWLAAALLISAGWQWKFARTAPDAEQKRFHRVLEYVLAATALWLVAIHAMAVYPGSHFEETAGGYIAPAACLALVPLAMLIRNVQKLNFLQIGRQRNLIYAVFATFLAVLYLSLIRRVSQWMEPYFPPEATAALLLFLPVAFFEPLQRLLRTMLRKTAQSEMDLAQRLTGPILEVARLGDVEKLRGFIESWISEQLQLAEVKLRLEDSGGRGRVLKASGEEFIIRNPAGVLGTMRVKAHGAMLSGETEAALEFLCEQLPGMLDLCHLIEEKLRLERELAERERLAVLGQMAASISHNLKNPLGSIKTILQVQLESPEMPESMRAETQMVLEEISRLAAKLHQLLHFSRPAVRGGAIQASCDIRGVIEEVLGVLRPEAEKRGVRLGSRISDGESKVDASAEALHDVISNLAVNALEASPKGGQVNVQLSWLGLECVVAVEDEGPGIPENLKEKVLEPFFTTKAQGTGLGLAIVAKRVAELGGELRVVSPVENGRGTKFEVRIWPAALQRGDGGKQAVRTPNDPTKAS
ncbi:MAG TPA: ATP-binding protein [Candidatus Acidoferrum sp.]|nr:ATP-binding protein [Candidatus Acidoferrum sp.]